MSTIPLGTTLPEHRANPASVHFGQRVFSFPVLLCAFLSVVAVWSARNRFNDPDLWWHLKVGELIWQTGELPQSDTLSYTTDGHAWIAHEWLVEVVMYGFFKLGGHAGLMLWLCLTTAALLVAGYALSALYSGNAKVALIGGLTVWFFATINLALRPLLVGHLLLAAELIFLHLGRTRDHRWLWALPPVFAVWVNCHGSFALGLAILGLHVLTSRLDFECGLVKSEAWPPAAQRTALFAFGASALALMLNPVGVELAAYPLNLFFTQADNLAFISEWQPLDFGSPRGTGVFALVGAIALLVMLRRKALRVEELALLFIGSRLAVSHSRMIFVFGILAAPILCRLAADLWRGYDWREDFPRVNAVLMAAALCIAAMGFPSAAAIERQVEQNNPTEAAAFIRQTGLEGRMLNHYAWGGYLIWALPEQKVFIDGRTDIFDWTGVLKDYMLWWSVREDPRTLLDKYRIDYCLLPRDAAITRVLGLMTGWEQAYADDQAVIFVRAQ